VAESEGFAVQTMGLRRSGLVAQDIDALLADNAITRMTLTLMYATDFYDQLEHRIIPALRSDFVVLADRYFYSLIARAAVRGIQRDYLHGLYDMAPPPDLTFWLKVRPEVAFDREFRKTQAISHWESADMSLSHLFRPFILYQAKIRKNLIISPRIMDSSESKAKQRRDRECEVAARIAKHLGIQWKHYKPSPALASLWR
jgi:dTMP kinase